MKLYTCEPAPNPDRLTMFMQYKGISIDTVQVDLGNQEQLGDDYLAAVPEGTVPVLVLDDESRLTEVIAIVHYLEQLYPERPLLGVTPAEKAMVLNWNHRLFNTIFMAIAEAFRNGHPAYKDRALPGPKNYPQITELAARGKARLDDALESMNSLLTERDWVAGDRFSFADIDLMVAISFAKWGARTELGDQQQALQAWRQRVKAELAS